MSDLITDNYRRQQEALHAAGNYGTTGAYFGPAISALAKAMGATSVLDYGCGSKRSLLRTLKLAPGVVYEGYDPGVPEFSDEPIPAELVCCIDVLEHIEPDLLDNVLDHLASLCDPYGFFTVQCAPARKTLPDGRNAHLIQEGPDWWLPRIESRFRLLARSGLRDGFCVVVCVRNSDASVPLGLANALSLLGPEGMPAAANEAPAAQPPTNAGRQPDPALARAAPNSAPSPAPAMFQVIHNGAEMLFNTPNETTEWRVNTLFQKEPDTIRWLEAMDEGSALLDVGANVGMYSVFAAKVRGAKVYAFEPEAQNYALLNANIASNGLSEQVIAWPVALSDQMKLDKLYLSDLTPGGSCHSFGSEVGFDLKPRASAFQQGSVSMTVDQLVDAGTLPVPDYIKIDVDGFEHKVLQGAARTLANPRVKSVIVELNTHLPEHVAAMQRLQGLGFDYDQNQAQGALRKGGAFEGVGEFIFTRKPADAEVNFLQTYRFSVPRQAVGRSVLGHVLDRVGSTPVAQEPFPHLVVDDVFPADYYQQMLAHFPAHGSLKPLAETGRVKPGLYEERLTVLFTDEDFARMSAEQQAFWRGFAGWMYTDQFNAAFISKFSAALEPRLKNILSASDALDIKGDALLVNDQTQYAIGPHTDATHRLVSFLFYMPVDASLRELGTSLYRHKDPAFECWTGLHYPFDDFVKASTVEFLPNRLLAFPKTARAFHGVERIERQGVNRRLLINNTRLLNERTY